MNNKVLSNVEFTDLVKGKTAEIYIARKGTVTVVRCDGHDYLGVNAQPFTWVVDPVGDYWRYSIEWRETLADYMCLQLRPPKSPRDWSVVDYPLKGELDCLGVYDERGELVPRFREATADAD